MGRMGAMARGAVAGVAGTLAMDLLWYRRFRRSGGTAGFVDWEFSAEVDSYEEAAAPAEVGRQVVEGVFDTDLAPETAGPMSDSVHWITGSAWGAIHGLVAASMARWGPALGPVTGVVAWFTSYAVLVPAGLYESIDSYDRKSLWRDLSAHLVFGTVTGGVFHLLARQSKGE